MPRKAFRDGADALEAKKRVPPPPPPLNQAVYCGECIFVFANRGNQGSCNEQFACAPGQGLLPCDSVPQPTPRRPRRAFRSLEGEDEDSMALYDELSEPSAPTP